MVKTQKSRERPPAGHSTHGGRIRVAKASISRLKLKLKSISNRNNGKNFKTKLQELKPVIIGWVSYFRLADAQGVMK